MLGSGVPPLAITYPTLNELIHHGVNGLHFHNSNELFEQLFILFYNNIISSNHDTIPSLSDQYNLENLRNNCINIERWDRNWDDKMINIMIKSLLI